MPLFRINDSLCILVFSDANEAIANSLPLPPEPGTIRLEIHRIDAEGVEKAPTDLIIAPVGTQESDPKEIWMDADDKSALNGTHAFTRYVWMTISEVGRPYSFVRDLKTSGSRAYRI